MFQNEDKRKHIDTKVEKDRRERYPVYLDGESVVGKVNRFNYEANAFFFLDLKRIYQKKKVIIKVRGGKKIEHYGIRVEFIGSIGK